MAFVVRLLIACLFAELCNSIKLSVGSKKRCIIEEVWTEQQFKGQFKWALTFEGTPEYVAIDLETQTQVFASNEKEGTFEITAKVPQFCFSFTSSLMCGGWRQTGECNPHGSREAEKDKSCDQFVDQGLSGFCECKSKSETGELVQSNKYFTCDHAGFTCQQICEDNSNPAAITFDFIAGKANGMEDVATFEHVATTETHLIRAIEIIEKAQQDIDDAKEEESFHQETSDRVNKLIIWLHILPIVIFSVSSVIQARIFSQIFRKNNVIS